jgi:hypothetical protein
MHAKLAIKVQSINWDNLKQNKSHCCIYKTWMKYDQKRTKYYGESKLGVQSLLQRFHFKASTLHKSV